MMKFNLKKIVAGGFIGVAFTGTLSLAAGVDSGVTEPRALVYNYFYGLPVKSLLRDNQHVLCDICPKLAGLLPYEEAKKNDTAKTEPSLIPFVSSNNIGSAESGQKASSQMADRHEVVGHTAYFGFDRHVLSKSEQSAVETYLDNFKASGGSTVRVEGHTCDIGPRAYNQKLSEKRAKAVAKIATGKGLEVSGVQGFGETQPVSQVRAKNRIAVIYVQEGVLSHEN